ncbi:hypothetical protein, partial [Sphingopyxis sp.]|uniref:hypothetical protein n=1 Tax=Sphingopyxis sp. TaxID=1908224 RepID=UPI001D595FCA
MHAKAAGGPNAGNLAGLGFQGLDDAFAGPGGGAGRDSAPPGPADNQPERLAKCTRHGPALTNGKNRPR